MALLHRKEAEMSLILRTQLFILVSFVWVTMLMHWAAFSRPPKLSFKISISLCLIFILFAFGRLIQQWRAPKLPRDSARKWLLLDPEIVWLSHVPMVGVIWLTFPEAPAESIPVFVNFYMGAMTVVSLATARLPPTRGFGSPLPLILPVSLALYLLTHPMLLSWTLAVWQFAAIIAFLAMRHMIEGLLNNAYESGLAAQAAKRAVEAERDAKTRFLASASHDLGQPLQAARMFFDQAMRYDVGEKRDKAVRGVHWAFDASEQLLGQMMAHLQLESGVVEPKLEPLVIGPLIAEVADMNEPAAGLAGVSLHAMPSGLRVLADAALVERALGNLIGNAIRHAKARRILIGARAHQGRVRIWVIDDGVGIALADIPRLFEDYVQGSDHGEEIRGGFGLGLATTRRLARLMGGDAGLEAKWVNGSAFWLDLPAA
jgi:signal transduction histidine kinase